MTSKHQIIIFYLAFIVYTGVLIWGLRKIGEALSEPGQLIKLLSEKMKSPGSPPPGPTPSPSPTPEPSFSRLAGAVGAMGLAAVFIGIGYWVLYALFQNGDLSKLQGLGVYFLSGSALFAPYAFNQLTKIFKA